ncbi:tRNA pseudouridine(55) synthase TruB [Demequina lignilytica]|uniref:tRNA pseudouridine synthase B n=1 Tax=Demequina lignilytica TaxID=3051663 RepID=A0AB35MIR4_9MICO|nr:tRNA pseudouridine(55) synthase TruB [Demequina sp. SYSU T0a273]MDN4483702.1 tRNA pseudouridine(55) synthase TruB [Demequina sp. SYSU T0a273]
MGRRGGPEPVPGLVVVDKPAGWTSHDVVARVRRLASTSKVGHAGTLDPMATGVLVLGIGRATKLLTYVVGHDKSYDATIRLGQSTVTDDAEGDVTSEADASAVTDEALRAAVADLTGDIQQRPSAVSAIKVDGKRSYARVRGGEDVELPPRPVTVSRFDVRAERRSGPLVDVDVTVDVSSGTYVRALARDLGAALAVGGHLTALRRTRVGDIDLAMARTLEDLGAVVEGGEAMPRIPLADAAAATLPVLEVSDRDATALGFGQWIDAPGLEGTAVAIAPGPRAIAIVEPQAGRAKPAVVFEVASASSAPGPSAPPAAAE